MTGAVSDDSTVQFSVTGLPGTAMTSFGSKRKPTELKSGISEDSKRKIQRFIMMKKGYILKPPCLACFVTSTVILVLILLDLNKKKKQTAQL